jgi:hypothetical protein
MKMSIPRNVRIWIDRHSHAENPRSGRDAERSDQGEQQADQEGEPE